jgi:hypothetical protein
VSAATKLAPLLDPQDGFAPLRAVSSFRYQSLRNDESLRERLISLAREKPRYDYRRLHAFMKREGDTVNHKRLRAFMGGHGKSACG